MDVEKQNNFSTLLASNVFLKEYAHVLCDKTQHDHISVT